MKNGLTLSIIAFAYSCLMFSQEAVPFNVQKEFYIYGNAQAIGNNIISKYDKKTINDNSVTNDDVDMVFVDIDDDPETFNSSSANLELPENKSKIVYAALYWTATYCYEQGYREDSNDDQFVFRGRRVYEREDINKVKLKLPNGSYKNITGTLLFDGEMSDDFTLNSPYVCFADVTRFLKNKRSVNGEYTVANVNTTKGFVSGGGAAGWLLYVVYEAPTRNPNYITTYNGFALSSQDPIKVKFENFKSLEEGEVKTSLTLAALEGDSALTGDQCILFNPISQRGTLLHTSNRPKNNFFNSQITNNNTIEKNRFPNSENTLGFDLVSMDLPTGNEPIIDNNTSEIEMVFNTESDMFYLFFTAFQTEISKRFYDEMKGKINEDISLIEDQKVTKQTNSKEKKTKVRLGNQKDKLDKERKTTKATIKEEKLELKKPLTKSENTNSKRKRNVLVIESGKPDRIVYQTNEPEKDRKLKKEKPNKTKPQTNKKEVSANRKRDVLVIESGKPDRIVYQTDEFEKDGNSKKEKSKKTKAETKKKETSSKQKRDVLVIESGKPNRIVYQKDELEKQTKTKKEQSTKNDKTRTKKSKTKRDKTNSKEKISVTESEKPNNKKDKQKKQPIVVAKKETVATVNPDQSLNDQSALVQNRETSKTELPTQGYYQYESQINNPNIEYIKRINKGYYIISGVYYDLDSALSYQEKLIENSISSKIFKDTGQEKFYIYIYNSEVFYDVFMMKESLAKKDLFKKIWILNINMKDRLLKRI